MIDHRPSSTPMPERDQRDLNRLLDLAESIQQRVERLSTKQYVLTAGLALYSLCGGFVCYIFTDKLDSVQRPITSFLAALIIGLLLLPTIFKIGRERRAELRALDTVLEILREAEAAVAKQQGWSTFERAEFRIRLARFRIGTSDNELVWRKVVEASIPSLK
jgi:hypothetical protein